MRKWLYTISVIVILGLLSIAYYVTGVRAEKEFNAFMKSADNLPNLTITADHYQRGWLKSTVHINAILHRPEQQYAQNGEIKTLPAQDISFSFNTTISHGPIIVVNNKIALGLGYARAEVPLPNEMLTQFNNVFTSTSTKPTFIVSLLLKYRNRLDVDFDVPTFKVFSKDGLAQIDWLGFESHWNLFAKQSQAKGYLDFKGATFKMGDSHGNIDAVHLKYDVTNNKNNILSGKLSVVLKTLNILIGKEPLIVIDGFQAVSQSKVKNELVDSSLKADLNKLTYHGLDYGPGVLNIALYNLDAEALAQIQQQLQTASNSNLTDAQQQVFLLTLLPELPKLLGKGAEFRIKQFQLSIPQGLIWLTAKIKLPNQQNGNQNPLQLINQVRANAAAEVPVSWLNELTAEFLKFKIQQRQLIQQQLAAEGKTADINKNGNTSLTPLSEDEINTLARKQADEQLVALVQGGVLIKKDNVYSIKITFKDGSFAVNGKPFNGNVIQ